MYDVEKVWTHNGLKCVAIMTDAGTRCGYVGIPKSHPLHGTEIGEESVALREMANAASNKPIGSRGVFSVLIASANKEGVPARPDVVFDVHGSLTYSGGARTYPVRNEDLWWFGFDCAHCGDGRDIARIKNPELKKVYESFPMDGIIRSLEYVIDHCNSLADQLQEIEEAKV